MFSTEGAEEVGIVAEGFATALEVGLGVEIVINCQEGREDQ